MSDVRSDRFRNQKVFFKKVLNKYFGTMNFYRMSQDVGLHLLKSKTNFSHSLIIIGYATRVTRRVLVEFILFMVSNYVFQLSAMTSA